jgi:hypothetical protein
MSTTEKPDVLVEVVTTPPSVATMMIALSGTVTVCERPGMSVNTELVGATVSAAVPNTDDAF